MSNRELWAWISGIKGMHYEKIKKLLKKFKSINNIYSANENDLIKQMGMSKAEARIIMEAKEKFDGKKFFEELDRQEIKLVTVEDKEYPEKLKAYNDKPYYLFYKGILPKNDMPVVAMVGARACSNYGRYVSKNIARELSLKGIQIISGMARGIDTYSGLGAIEGGSPSFAVLGCGVDICYPSENIGLYNNLCKNGGIISEYPPRTKPLSWHFPQRNRIISGLADKIVVVEAKEKSGSLITVEWALEQGKDVMAVPGQIGDKLSEGCNRLIKSGAGIITSPEDITEELKYVVFKKGDKFNVEEKPLEKDLALLYSELRLQPKNVYELMEVTGWGYETLLEKLLQLQLMGLAVQPSENYYSRVII